MYDKSYYERNKALCQQRSKKWKDKNREKVNAYNRERYKKNPVEFKRRNEKYESKNREKVKHRRAKYQIKYKKENREKINAKQGKYRLKNKDKFRSYSISVRDRATDCYIRNNLTDSGWPKEAITKELILLIRSRIKFKRYVKNKNIKD